MTVAEWILVAFLSVALLVFLVVFIVFLIKLIDFTDEAKKVVLKSQDIADKADDIVDNVRGLSTVGGVVRKFTEQYLNSDKSHHRKTKSKNKE